MSSFKESIQRSLVGRTLKEMRLHQVNPGHVIIEEGRCWSVDGGVELTLDDSTWCFGWYQERDEFTFQPRLLNNLSPELESAPLDLEAFWSLQQLLGQRIDKVEIETMIWEDFASDLELVLDLRLSFSGGHTLQIATVDFDLEREGTDDITYNLSAFLLVSVNRTFPIKHPLEQDPTLGLPREE